MYSWIREAMKEHISTLFKIAPVTEKRAQIKLSKVIPLIGQSSAPKSHPKSLSRHDFPSNMRQIMQDQSDRMMRQIGHPFNRNQWYSSPALAKVYYQPWTNALEIPAGILQPPLYHGQQVHPARNFGAIGSIIGHELIHGFDRIGRQVDSEGRNKNWWSLYSTFLYWTRSQCMKKQYSKFQVQGVMGNELGLVHGNSTLNENIADNGGVELAWDAYRKYMTRFQPETHGVSEKEGDQMFFLAFGQSMCSKSNDRMLRHQLLKDSHAPNKWRVNGAVMNNMQFATVFNCDSSTPMNPRKKCRVW